MLQRQADPLFRRVYDVIQAGDLGNLTLGMVTMPYYRPQTYYDQADWRGTWALNDSPSFFSPDGNLGTDGGIQIEGEAIRRWVLADPAKATIEPPRTGTPAHADAGRDARGIAPTGHIAIFRDFVVALRENRAPQVDVTEGRRSLATVLAVYQAAELL